MIVIIVVNATVCSALPLHRRTISFCLSLSLPRRFKLKFVEIKKAWEILLLAHPWSQALALPLIKDKQRSQPTPSDYII